MLSKPTYSGSWEDGVRKFIDQYCGALIADYIAFPGARDTQRS